MARKTPDDPDKKAAERRQAAWIYKNVGKQRQEIPSTPTGGEETLEAFTQKRMEQILDSFVPDKAGGYQKTIDKKAFGQSHASVEFSYDENIAAQLGLPAPARSGNTALRAVRGAERDVFVKEGGKTLAQVWPLFGLLYKLDDKSKAEDLRAKINHPPREDHTITLTRAEYTKLEKALAKSRER